MTTHRSGEDIVHDDIQPLGRVQCYAQLLDRGELVLLLLVRHLLMMVGALL
jgi:hypothetical protein